MIFYPVWLKFWRFSPVFVAVSRIECGNLLHFVVCQLEVENRYVQHYPQILNALGISGIESAPCSWIYTGKDGAQFDLLIDRIDNVINICEMKFSTSPYEVTQQYLTKLLEKVMRFKEISKTRKSPMLTFVTSQGLKPNSCARQIPKSITLDVFYNSPNLP